MDVNIAPQFDVTVKNSETMSLWVTRWACHGGEWGLECNAKRRSWERNFRK